ncbi:MFS transporter [Nocardia cyriacigeorgica]|uniref:MFS transporter n=1 Tax=Nocardia cyriacigeorgica TaxID=135487 RepID=UPI002453B90B|nr:MFS transporter [Nocardia cyriacigeorgica]
MVALAAAAEDRVGSRWQLARAAWAVTAVFALSNSPTPLYVFWQQQIRFSSATLTLVFAAYIAGLIGALLVAGRAADTYGRKRVVVPGIFIALVSAALFMVANTVAALIVARLLVGVAVGIVVSAGMAAIVDLGGEGRRGSTSMLASVAMVFGAGLGPLMGGAVYQVTDSPVLPVFTVNVTLLIAALIGYVRLPLPRPARQPHAGPAGFPWPRLPYVPSRNRTHIASGAAVFAPGLTATSFVLSLGPSLLILAVGTASPLLAGGAASLMFLAATGSQLALTGLTVDRLFALGAASTAFAMVGVILTVLTESPVLFVAAAVLAGTGQGLGQLGGLRLIAQHVETRRRAEANAALNISAYLPAAVLTVATGYAVSGWGMPIAATTLAGVLAALAAALGIAAYQRNSQHA